MKKDLTKSEYDLLNYSLPYIERESRNIWYKVKDVTSFEHECINKLLKAGRSGIEVRHKKSFVLTVIRKVRNDHLRRRGMDVDKNIFDNSFEVIKDVLADVESEVFANEKVANLAGSDLRKKIVLNAWMDGCTCTKEISGLLADKLGGKQETHRKFILRFKEKCKQALDGVA